MNAKTTIKVLIVDDSLETVRELTALINWRELEVDKVLTAPHAIKAKEILKQELPDILICDINLPKESGLSLAAWAVKTVPSLSLIFLEEEKQADRLYEAIKLKARDIFIKPVDIKQLKESIQLIVQEKRIWQKTQDTYRVGAYWQARQQFLEELFWRDSLLQIQEKLENVQYYADLQQIQVDVHSLYSLILISVSNQNIKQFQMRQQPDWTTLQALAGDILLGDKASRRIVVFPDYFVVISEQFNQEELRESCRQLIQKSNQTFSIHLYCYIRIGILYSDFHTEWQYLCQFMEQDIEQRETLVFLPNPSPPSAPPALPVLSYELPSRLKRLLYTGEETEFFQAYHSFLSDIRKQGNLNSRFLKSLQKDLLQCFMVVLDRKGICASLLPDTLLTLSVRRLCELEGQIHCFFEQLRQGIPATQEKHTISRLLIPYIDEHLSEPISREVLAKLSGLTPDYMSRIFKQETGLSVKEYIIEIRLQKASLLLLTSEKSVAEISGEVGYPNFAYFSKLYKKRFGKAPSEVRKERR